MRRPLCSGSSCGIPGGLASGKLLLQSRNGFVCLSQIAQRYLHLCFELCEGIRSFGQQATMAQARCASCRCRDAEEDDDLEVEEGNCSIGHRSDGPSRGGGERNARNDLRLRGRGLHVLYTREGPQAGPPSFMEGPEIRHWEVSRSTPTAVSASEFGTGTGGPAAAPPPAE